MASQILRVSIKGSMPAGEVWSTNPCWEINGSSGATVSASDCVTIAQALALVTVPTAMLQSWGNGTNLDGYRVEARQITGGLEALGEASRVTPAGGTGTNTHPHATAIVLSLRTPGVGASARGRLYFPATGQSLQNTDYRIANAGQATLLAAMKTYLSAMEAAIKVTLPEANLTVWSRTTSNFHNVNNIQLGNVLDSQRRRRDKVTEGYQTVSFP